MLLKQGVAVASHHWGKMGILVPLYHRSKLGAFLEPKDWVFPMELCWSPVIPVKLYGRLVASRIL